MSTRSNILIVGKSAKLWLYRHCDGYPAGNGADIARALKLSQKNWCRLASFTQNLLDLRYEQASYETKPKRIYEVTDSEHGDIEWLYTLKFTRKEIVSINVRERKIREDVWVEHGTLDEKAFRAFVARDLVAMRKRIKAYKARSAA